MYRLSQLAVRRGVCSHARGELLLAHQTARHSASVCGGRRVRPENEAGSSVRRIKDSHLWRTCRQSPGLTSVREFSGSSRLQENPSGSAADSGGRACSSDAATINARHGVDIRSCLFFTCSAADDKRLRAAFQTGADAVALDLFAVLDGETQLNSALSAVATAIESSAPSYQMHFIQIDANLTQESEDLESTDFRVQRLAKTLQLLVGARGRHGMSLDGFVLRNVQDAEDVLAVEKILETLDRNDTDSLRFIAAIETPMSYFAALQIADSSPRNVALIGSSQLFAENMQCRDDSMNEAVTAVKVRAVNQIIYTH